MQRRVVEIPNLEGAWHYFPRRDERPYRLTDGRRYTTENVVRRLRDHRRRNGFTSYGFCTANQAETMGLRIRLGQLCNFVEVWFENHHGNRPAMSYSEDQLW